MRLCIPLVAFLFPVATFAATGPMFVPAPNAHIVTTAPDSDGAKVTILLAH